MVRTQATTGPYETLVRASVPESRANQISDSQPKPDPKSVPVKFRTDRLSLRRDWQGGDAKGTLFAQQFFKPAELARVQLAGSVAGTAVTNMKAIQHELGIRRHARQAGAVRGRFQLLAHSAE